MLTRISFLAIVLGSSSLKKCISSEIVSVEYAKLLTTATSSSKFNECLVCFVTFFYIIFYKLCFFKHYKIYYLIVFFETASNTGFIKDGSSPSKKNFAISIYSLKITFFGIFSS